MMNMKLATLAVASLALTPLTAFAQSAPAPINQTGPGVTPPVSTSTDMGIGSQSGNTWATSGGISAPVLGGAYASVPSDAYVGTRSYAAVPTPRHYRGYGGGYGAYSAAPGVSYGYADEY